MSRQRWTISFLPLAVRDKYHIPRGEAALFREAIAMLYDGPQIADAKPVAGILNTYEYSRNGYMISYEVLEEVRTIRVIYFERE